MSALMFLTSCSDEDFVDNPSGETFIYRLKIANAGLTGTDVVEGKLNEGTKTVEFTIPAETDIEAVKFDKKLSLGAHLDKDSYDFSQSATQEVKVVNGDNVGVYNVTVTLLSPTETPLITSMTVKLKDGSEKNAYVSEIDKSLYLGCESEESVEIKSVTCMPKRSAITYTKAENGVVYKSNPGTIKLNFMGLEKEYRILFSSTPVFGADFTKGTAYDHSGTSGAIFGDYAAENTRSADFDGKNLLIVSRQGGVFPRLIPFEEIKAGNPSGVVLNTSGVAGGTYLISAGRLSHNHIYICNLTTKIDQGDGALKVYHWADANAAPEVIFEFKGDASGVDLTGNRLGDNISVNLDENGNGTMFFVSQNGTTMLRCDVSNFNKVSNPTYIQPAVSADYYASVNQVGNNNEYVYTSVKAPIVLMDRNGSPLYKMDIESIPVRCTDARIITYDSERYLIATSGRQGTWSGDKVSTFYVYDLSLGANTVLAMTTFEKGEKQPIFSFELGGSGSSAPAANTGWGIVDGKLRLFSAATKAGFAVFEFPEKE